MLTKDFAFTLPEHLIAVYPTPNRTGSRLLVINPETAQLADQQFTDIVALVKPGDLLVINNSKVIKARLFGEKASGGKIEILVERIVNDHSVWAHVRASKSPKPGSWLHIADNIRILVREFNAVKGLFLLNFSTPATIIEILDKHGLTPLPPYFNRAAETSDQERYQTVYAQHPGSVAAPTAGLHFDDALLQQLKNNNVEIGTVTLHVGAGTFQPVRVANLAEHKMHSEYMQLSAELCEKIVATKQRGGRVIAVGTTVVRVLESAALKGKLHSYSGETDIFIKPGFQFKIVDALLTNFHLPESTLLMLVSAFAGMEQTLAAYQHAIEQQYRFYSYGDAMFITGHIDAI